MEYTYKGKDYPKEIKLNYPEIKEILCKPRGDITLGEATWLIGLPDGYKEKDCENLICQQMGLQWGKDLNDLKQDNSVNPHIINNALLLLCDFETYYYGEIEVIPELLRQSDDFFRFNNIIDADNCVDDIILSAIYRSCTYSPKMLEDELLEEGLSTSGKMIAAKSLGIIGSVLMQLSEKQEDSYKEVVRIVKEVLEAYLKDFPNNGLCDKTLLSHIVDTASTIGASCLEPEILSLFSKSLIDENIINEEDAIAGLNNGGWTWEEPITDVRKLLLPSTV